MGVVAGGGRQSRAADVKKLVEERTRIAELEIKQQRIKQRTAEEAAMFERLSKETAIARTSLRCRSCGARLSLCLAPPGDVTPAAAMCAAKVIQRCSDDAEDQRADEAFMGGMPRENRHVSFGSRLPCERLSPFSAEDRVRFRVRVGWRTHGLAYRAHEPFV